MAPMVQKDDDEDGEEIQSIKCVLRKDFVMQIGPDANDEKSFVRGPKRLTLPPKTARANLAKFENVEEVRRQLGDNVETFAQPNILKNRAKALDAPPRDRMMGAAATRELADAVAAGVVQGLIAAGVVVPKAGTGPVPVAPPGPHPTGPGTPKAVPAAKA